MLYLIGLGLNERSISHEGLEAIEKCKRVYLDDLIYNTEQEITDLMNFFELAAAPPGPAHPGDRAVLRVPGKLARAARRGAARDG